MSLIRKLSIGQRKENLKDIKEGSEIRCTYCDSPMIYDRGRWKWNHPVHKSVKRERIIK